MQPPYPIMHFDSIPFMSLNVTGFRFVLKNKKETTMLFEEKKILKLESKIYANIEQDMLTFNA